MLVHMAPEEVRGLQALAKAHGGSLTINPDTGLPEAGFLKSLLPAIIGFGLNLIAPGVGSAIGAALGTSGAVGTGLLVGGVEALRTGDLSKGLMAGLGAYGGANFAGGLESLGARAATGEGMAALVSPEAVAASGDISMSGLSNAEMAKLMGATATPEQLAATRAALGPGEILQRGYQAATGEGGLQSLASQMGGNKAALMSAGAAASPILADMAVKSQLPQTRTSPTAYIRPYTYDPYSQEYTALTPVKAEEAAGRPFPYSIPPGMADGGVADGGLMGLMYRNEPVVRMADGGSAGYMYATGEGGIGADKYYQNIANYIAANPNLTYDQAQAAMNEWGVSAADLARAQQLHPTQISGANVHALTNKDIGAAENAAETYGGLAGISSNINYQLANDPALQDRTAVEAEMNKYALNEADFERATGKTLDEYFTKQPVNVREDAIKYGGGYDALTCPTGYTFDPVKNACVPNTEELTRVTEPTDISTAPETALAPGVSGGGNTVVNPNGTITTTPDIPYRPEGGFTGMKDVRDAYTKGGGSLGYRPYVPTSYEDFLTKYGTATGGSKSAYDYLMGRPGAAYPLRPVTPTGEVARPYAEAVMGVPRPSYQSKYTWDTSKQQYVANPNYQPSVINAYNKDGQMITAVRESDNRYRGSDNNYYDAAGKLVEAVKKDETSAETEKEEIVTGDKNGGLMAEGGLSSLAYNLGSYSDGGRLLRGPGDGVSDSIPAVIGKDRPARLADGEFVVPARIVSELGNGSTEAGARKLYEMMDRVQKARGKTVGKGRVAKDSRSDKYLPA